MRIKLQNDVPFGRMSLCMMAHESTDKARGGPTLQAIVQNPLENVQYFRRIFIQFLDDCAAAGCSSPWPNLVFLFRFQNRFKSKKGDEDHRVGKRQLQRWLKPENLNLKNATCANSTRDVDSPRPVVAQNDTVG